MSSALSPALVPRAARSLLDEVRTGYPVVTLTGPRGVTQTATTAADGSVHLWRIPAAP